jgi:hypothetical protein
MRIQLQLKQRFLSPIGITLHRVCTRLIALPDGRLTGCISL